MVAGGMITSVNMPHGLKTNSMSIQIDIFMTKSNGNTELVFHTRRHLVHCMAKMAT